MSSLTPDERETSTTLLHEALSGGKLPRWAIPAVAAAAVLIAVALMLSATYEINWHITEPGGITFAANIALKWNEAGTIGLSALVASGLVLFVITLAVNMAARIIIARRSDFSGAN